MTLEFIDRRRGSADRYSWMPPFDVEVAYDNPQWWDEVPYHLDDPWSVQVLEDGVEVARVQFAEGGDVNPTYTGVPVVGAERLMIHRIEVAIAARGRKIGTQVIRGVEERNPDRRLIAYSEGADGFWASLGWERYIHPTKRSRPLFIQPPR
ncbi:MULTISPECIES: hypothetical protein [Mycobacteriaceae]|uniref:GNAT family N-acetyltransferase n=2 Tax=Mycobacteriaceae TaxID=1762 RepID=A0A1Q9W8A7_9MYCO|nr:MULTISPECIES: hypothetical protein [Mycobacteriaceae]MBP2451911.1 GNAT superfamily N-acetyltransferase [Mycolicibacterium lutetiense]OHT97150.1 GNAT family N-acetyltransferase [Mycobacterium syngnathidarum]OLT94395.1 GNAT family N-acetyltransferase [Mycobacterium syngnathidarum]OMB85347.1 GNAT family acetyltransferase [Mycolicibacterium conceptionense]